MRQPGNPVYKDQGNLVLSNADQSISLPLTIEISGKEEPINLSDIDFVIDEPVVEEGGISGTIIIGIILILLLIAIFIVVALNLRRKEEKKFDQYIEETKKK